LLSAPLLSVDQRAQFEFSRHNDPDIQYKVAYSRVAQINRKRIAVSGAWRKLERHLAGALDAPATITGWTETPPFIHASAARTHNVTGHIEGHATPKPCLISVQYHLNAKPPQTSAALLPITEEILSYVIQQFRDRRSYREEVIENSHWRSGSQWL
jgi:hypothetical protein